MKRTRAETATENAASGMQLGVSGIALYYILGPKGGIGKTTTARLLIDGLMLSGAHVKVVQVDRAPTLPLLYPDTVTVEVPSADDMRADPHASMVVFEPVEALIASCRETEGVHTIVIDVGAAQNQKAFIDFLARGRLDRHLAQLGVRATAMVLMTAEQSAMSQSMTLMDALREVHPTVEIVPVLNARGGPFRFVEGTPAHRTYSERVVPLMRAGRSLALPATADGSWQAFEAAGFSFTEAVLADEETLKSRLGLSRLMCTALQGEVSEFLAAVWPRLGVIAGFTVDGFHAG